MKKYLLALLLLLVAGCSELSQHDAEEAAKLFLSERVKFFAQNATELNSYNVTAISSYREGNEWVVVLHIESEVKGMVKKNDVAFTVGRAGKVTSFNGQKVAQ